MSSTCQPKNGHLLPELEDLYGQVDLLSPSLRSNLLPLCERVIQFFGIQKRMVQAAQQAVAQSHLDIKYLQFDLEATRRERDAFRQELESE